MSFGRFLKAGYSVLGLIIVGYLVIAFNTPKPADWHPDCWYKMQATARFHAKGATPEQISDAADNYCAMARDLSRKSSLSRTEAEDIISRM